MDYIVHGVPKSQTRLSEFHFPVVKTLLPVQGTLVRSLVQELRIPLALGQLSLCATAREKPSGRSKEPEN